MKNSLLSVQTDWPRSRGFYLELLSLPPCQVGLAPLAGVLLTPVQMCSGFFGISPVRGGLRSGVCYAAPKGRISPVRGGSMAGAPAAGAAWRDYPRSRGVYPRGRSSSVRKGYLDCPESRTGRIICTAWFCIVLARSTLPRCLAGSSSFGQVMVLRLVWARVSFRCQLRTAAT